MKIDVSESHEIIVPLGKALKDARLLASLSVDEVAEKLNLGPSTVHDLEDALDSVLETQKYPVIYLRGYLANYAKLVGLSTLELFVEYQQLGTVQKKAKSISSASLAIPLTKKRSKFLPVLFVFILISIVITALLSLFNKPFLNAFQAINSTFSTSIESVENEGVSKKLIITENTDTSDTPAEALNDTSTQVNKDAAKVNVNPEAIAHVEGNIDKNIDEKIVQDATVQVVASTEVIEDVSIAEMSSEPAPQVEASFDAFEAVASDTENDEQALAEEATEEALLAGPEGLTLAFNADCWTEVFDATGERIAFGLYKTGRVLMLSGTAPFQLKLGDPSVVEIQYQDQIIEGEFTPGRSAQFSVPLS
jgi:cytoskeleton protein RodZ